ncbi:MAG TPA: dihydroorotate dehydrogenase [Oligella sp.]|nr:dihydroorotate dehydrogenase [Oligella sp.]
MTNINLSVNIGSLQLQNPIMPASGTFAEQMCNVIDINRLGAIVTKTITQDLREGNPPPRIAEFADAALFSIGIPSKGLDHYINETVPFYKDYTPPLIASISADSVEEFGELAALISVPGVSAIEANISCPNLKKDGQAFGVEAQTTHDVIKAMVNATSLPIWAKLTPNATNIVDTALAAEEAGAEALIVANAILGMSIDPHTFLPRLANVTGGLTGPALKPILLRMTHQCSKAATIPIIGCGGISNANDVIEYLLAGASAVQIGTANFISPHSMINALNKLEEFCKERSLTEVSKLTGAMLTHKPLQFNNVNTF